jgi:hypothetical protein
MKSALKKIGQVILTTLGVLSVIGLWNRIFEYGEGLADLSTVEIWFLFLVVLTERRCFIASGAAGIKATDLVWRQLSVFGPLAVIGMVVTSRMSAGWQSAAEMASMLLAILITSPAPQPQPQVSP